MLNTYAETHEKQTVLDALEECLLTIDATGKVAIEETVTRHHKIKYFNQQQLTKLLNQLNLGKELSIDYFFLLVAKTDLRFNEDLGITSDVFDLSRLTLSVNKTRDYKSTKVSIASVTQRLGHSNMNTTQRTYLHDTQALENANTDKIMRYLKTLM
ncbi:hypothetical protein [Weissella sagaensis]|uniref:hypothetical protein n=1 Tax=Weissella sagaensis TaxID=2559928 RepID=UPI000A86FB4A